MGNEVQPTPGPWQGREGFHPLDGRYSALIYGDDRAFFYGPNREANARLIAAAQETAAERDRLNDVNADLLESLEHAVRFFDTLTNADTDRYRAAIAKATEARDDH